MYNGYTYSRRGNTLNFYCSKKDQGCRAGVKLDEHGRLLIKRKLIHEHRPPNYFITDNGTYIKLSS